MKSKYIWKAATVFVILPMIFTSCTFASKAPEKKQRQITNVFLPKESKAGTVEFQLYFGSKDLKDVEPEERSVKRDELLGNVLLNELIKGPAIKSELKPLLPAETKVLNFSIRDNVGYVNLEVAILNKIKVDKEQEKSIVEGIVNTMCQLPGIDKVQIMFDNQKRDTFCGNVDISKPLSPQDF